MTVLVPTSQLRAGTYFGDLNGFLDFDKTARGVQSWPPHRRKWYASGTCSGIYNLNHSYTANLSVYLAAKKALENTV
jgi:hypothetical protein